MFTDFFKYNTERITKNLWFYFSFIFVINLVFKIIYLDYSSFWYDEIISVQSASLDFGHIKHVSEWDKNPPFYYYCLSVWIKLFNDSEFVVRLLSVVFSSVSAAVLFLLANKYFNKATSIITSVLFLSSNFLFYYAHEARSYSLVLLLALLSSYLFLSFRDNYKWKTIILLGIINFLLIYTHYISGLIILFQSVFCMFYFKKEIKWKYLISLFIMLAFVFLRFTKKQFALIIDFNSSKSSFWLQKSDISYLLEVVNEFLFVNYLAVLLVVFLMFVSLVLFKLKKLNFQFVYCMTVGFGSIAFLFLIGKLTPIFLDRYLVFSVPFIFLSISFGFSLFKNNFLKYIPILFIFLVGVFNIDFKTDKGMDYKNAMCFIKAVKTNADLVIVKTKDIQPLFCYYFDNTYFKDKKKDLPEELNIDFCNSFSDLKHDPSKFKRVIVIDSFDDLNSFENEFVLKLSEVKSKVISYNRYKDIKISFYQ